MCLHSHKVKKLWTSRCYPKFIKKSFEQPEFKFCYSKGKHHISPGVPCSQNCPLPQTHPLAGRAVPVPSWHRCQAAQPTDAGCGAAGASSAGGTCQPQGPDACLPPWLCDAVSIIKLGLASALTNYFHQLFGDCLFLCFSSRALAPFWDMYLAFSRSGAGLIVLPLIMALAAVQLEPWSTLRGCLNPAELSLRKGWWMEARSLRLAGTPGQQNALGRLSQPLRAVSLPSTTASSSSPAPSRGLLQLGKRKDDCVFWGWRFPDWHQPSQVVL